MFTGSENGVTQFAYILGKKIVTLGTIDLGSKFKFLPNRSTVIFPKSEIQNFNFFNVQFWSNYRIEGTPEF